jgi:hypothetical protein
MQWKHLKEANLQGPVVMSGIIILMAKHAVLCLGLIWAMYFSQFKLLSIFKPRNLLVSCSILFFFFYHNL